MPQTKVGSLAAKLAESGWLAALAAVPLFFNPRTVRIFEEEKVPLLRSVALFVVVALLVWAAERRRRGALDTGRQIWRLPLVKPALVLATSYALSTILSVAPAVSFWGAYVRCQGTYTWLAYVTVFLALAVLARERTQIERAVTIVLLASLPVAVYGLIQHLGYDPLVWDKDVARRVTSTAGNPIFLSAYLIMVIPLALARVIEQARIIASPTVPGRRALRRLAPACRLLLYGLLLALQLLTVVFSQSRGPFVGLGAGLTLFFLVFFFLRRRRWFAVATAGAIAVAVLLLGAMNLPGTPLAPLRDVPYAGRLARILDTEHDTGKVRVLVWEAATNLLRANPRRAVSGYGPETIFFVLRPFYPPALAHYEKRGTFPDRAHNETLDALITTGAIGLIAELLVFLALFVHLLQWLGMIRTAGERRVFIGAALIGGAAGALGVCLADGSLRFAAVGLPAGVAAGMLLYSAARAIFLPGREAPGALSDGLLLAALLAAATAHFVEIQLGIPTVTTRLYFWAYAGLAVAIGALGARGGGHGAPAAEHREVQLDAARALPPEESMAAVGTMVGLVMVLLTFSFYRGDAALRVHWPALVCLLGSAWLPGALFVAVESGGKRDWLANLGGYWATTAGIWLLFAAVYRPWVNWRIVVPFLNPAIVQSVAARSAHSTSILYALVLFVIAFDAFVRHRREGAPGAGFAAPARLRAGAYAVGVAVAALIAVFTNLNSSRADTFSKQGQVYERRHLWAAAGAVYEEALRLQPAADRYAANLARVLVEQARQAARKAAGEKERYLVRAVGVLEKAQWTNPLNVDHPRNLARVHRSWAGLSADSAAKARHLEIAEGYYGQAVTMSPNNAALRNEWATLQLERQDPGRALAILGESVGVDDLYTTTHWLRAKAHLAAGTPEEALADYDRALAVNPRLLPAWSGKAVTLARLGRLREAIETSRQTLEIAPDDLITHRNLALLYSQSGKRALALREAEAALALTPPESQAPLAKFIAELQAEQ